MTILAVVLSRVRDIQANSDAAHIVAVMTETPVLGQRRAIEGYFKKEAEGRL